MDGEFRRQWFAARCNCALESAKACADCIRDGRRGYDPGLVKTGPEQWHADRCRLDDQRGHRPECFAQSVICVVRPRRGVQNCHEFAGKWFETDKPIKCVLDGSGHAMSVFRTGNKQRICASDRTLKTQYAWRKTLLKIRIEQRQLTEPGEDRDVDVAWCKPRSGT